MFRLKLIFILAVISVSAFFLCACSDSAEDDSQILLTVGEESIELEEYEIYLQETVKSFEEIGGNDIWDTDFDGKTAFDTAKDNALNSLVMVKITVQKAVKSGISLSDEEIVTSKQEAEKYTAEYGNNISPNIVEGVMSEKALYRKMRERILSEYTISMEGFDSFLNERLDYYRKELSKIKYSVIFVKDKIKALDISRRAEKGEDFSILMREYPSEANISGSVSLARDISGISIDRNNITAGYVSKTIETSGGFAIYKIEAVQEPSNSDVQKAAQKDFELDSKDRLFNDMLNTWKKEIHVSVNENLFNNIAL